MSLCLIWITDFLGAEGLNAIDGLSVDLANVDTNIVRDLHLLYRVSFSLVILLYKVKSDKKMGKLCLPTMCD
jgi:hypothetical protein